MLRDSVPIQSLLKANLQSFYMLNLGPRSSSPDAVPYLLPVSLQGQTPDACSQTQLYHEIKIMFASMLMRVAVKPWMQCLTTRKLHKVFYDAIYKYSHKKLLRLLDFGCFALIFKKFVETGALDEMLAQDPTLLPNFELHRERARELVRDHCPAS